MTEYNSSEIGVGYATPGGPEVREAATHYVKTTDVQEGRARQYTLSHRATASRSTGELMIQEAPKRPATLLTTAPERAFAFSAAMRAARECAEKVRSVANDPVDIVRTVDDLAYALDTLWDLRELKPPDWQDLMTAVQGILKSTRTEDISLDQRIAVAEVVDKCLSLPNLRPGDVRRALNLLEDSGLDIWAGIGGKPTDE